MKPLSNPDGTRSTEPTGKAWGVCGRVPDSNARGHRQSVSPDSGNSGQKITRVVRKTGPDRLRCPSRDRQRQTVDTEAPSLGTISGSLHSGAAPGRLQQSFLYLPTGKSALNQVEERNKLFLPMGLGVTKRQENNFAVDESQSQTEEASLTAGDPTPAPRKCTRGGSTRIEPFRLGKSVR